MTLLDAGSGVDSIPDLQPRDFARIERPISHRIRLESPERQARQDRLDILTGVVYICEDGTQIDPALENPELAKMVLSQIFD